MRVISQDGTKDFPYDSSSASVYAGCINGRICEDAVMWWI